MTRRIKQLNSLMRQEISELLQRNVKDPRIKGIISVTEVEVSPDIMQARVFVSVMGSEEEKAETFEGLNAASGFLRRELRGSLSLRHIPELVFQRDNSIEEGGRLLHLIEQVSASERQSGPSQT